MCSRLGCVTAVPRFGPDGEAMGDGSGMGEIGNRLQAATVEWSDL